MKQYLQYSLTGTIIPLHPFSLSFSCRYTQTTLEFSGHRCLASVCLFCSVAFLGFRPLFSSSHRPCILSHPHPLHNVVFVPSQHRGQRGSSQQPNSTNLSFFKKNSSFGFNNGTNTSLVTMLIVMIVIEEVLFCQFNDLCQLNHYTYFCIAFRTTRSV